jgi:pimeloyl-ACP methyl ester carboxylesterase
MATEPSPVAGIGLDEAGELLVAQIKALGGGRPVVVVAHSMSGTMLTRAAQLVPDLVAHAVYLTAAIPVSGLPTSAYMAAPEFEGSLVMKIPVADPEQIGALRIDPLSDDPEYRDMVRTALYHDVEPEVAATAMRLLTPDAPLAPLAGITTLTADGYGRVPRSFMVCAQDRAIPPALQRKYIENADAAFPDNPTTVYTLDSSHSPFLSMPGKVAEVIGKILAA